MEIVVKGRHKEVPERFRQHVTHKLERIQRLDARVLRLDVEVIRERNPRMAGSSDRVEITCRRGGPVVRAEAAASDPYGALDLAMAKLEERLRRDADRRHARVTRVATARPAVVGAVPPAPGPGDAPPGAPTLGGPGEGAAEGPADTTAEGSAQPGPDAPPLVGTDGSDEREAEVGDGLIVREKAHRASPMSIEDALHAMELVGHDFYLFRDKLNGAPSVVYRRRGYSYGVLRLVEEPPEG